MRTMDEVHLWLGLDKTTVVFEPSDLPREIIKICVINHHIFALTRNNAVYHSTFECSFEKTLVFKNTNISAIDIACNNEILFFVNDCGQVFKTTPEDLNSRQEIVLEELSKCCSHGYRTSGQRVKVKAIAAERCSCFYITENGQLWVSGDQPKLGLKNEIPQKVTFFEKHCVISVACGDNFSIALAYKPGHCIPEKDDSDTDDEKDGEVFISNCPLCMSSPTSQHSTSETCPLGLPITNASDDRYSTSTTSKDNSAEDKKSTDDSSSGLSDCKADRKKNSEELKDHENADKNDVSRNSQNSSNSVEVSGTSTSKADENDNGNEEEKEEKKNEFFINTEAARQFLTRQLSWVSSYGSAGDDFVECAEASFVRPSQIIRQNVSNVANMVYEGVKTVGDRGVTLLRHMSGGSEASGVLVGCESFEELSAEDFIVPASSITSSLSGGTSDRYEESEVGVTERVAAMVRVGARLLATELWSWGDVNHGQLGTGDTVKRNKPTIIARLTGIGIHQIACGHDHALALSLDGRVFAWGKNNYCQVSVKVNTDQSSPQPISLPTERAKRIAAGDNFSLIAAHDDCIYYMGKGCNKAITKLEIPSLLENTSTQKEIFSTRHISGCLNTSVPTSAAMRDLVVEQNFLEETLLVQNTLIKPLQKKGGLVQETNVYDILCTYHTDIMNVTCLYVRSLQDYSYQKVDECGITVIQNVDEFVRTYRCYLGAVCDVIALSGFAHIARLVDIPQNMYTLFHHEYVKKKKENQEAVVFSAILNPLKRLKSYRGTIQKLITWNESRCANEDQKLAFGTKLKDALTKWEQLCEEQEQRICEADATRKFWESSGRVVELLRSPERRLIRESRSHPLSVINSGRFSSHWFLLFTDVLVHMIGGNHTVHQLPTLWVDVVQDTDSMQNALQLTMPEETLVLYTPTAHDRLEWLHCLQGAVKKSLDKQNSHPPPAVRNAKYTFTKHSVYKDAKYSGRWCSGKLHGPGKIEWSDGRVYVGQFQNGQMCGLGRMENPGMSTYEGHWKDGQQNGYGLTKYTNGDVYEGYFKDGVPHGHGLQKQGHFMSSLASVYIGEWVNGVKQGYGVMDDIATGEKYLGSWSNNMKHGCGLIVTLDGIYYEGVFMQDVLTGRGVMVFEDGTHYEGEFRAAGVFNGKGTLTFNSGDRLEGLLHGAWNEGIKVTGTLHKNMSASPQKLNSKPGSFGKLCVAANQKWKAIFRQCYQHLGILELPGSKGGKTNIDPQKAWENVAVFITHSQMEILRVKDRGHTAVEQLDTIPQFGRDHLDKESYQELRTYLGRAFDSQHHPLGRLLAEATAAYIATYGGVRVHPLLLIHAVAELHSITLRIYEVVQVLFPALPPIGQELRLAENSGSDQEGEVVTAASLLHPVLLPRVHSALFVLYALHNKEEDDSYWKRLLKWNRQSDMTLLAFLGIDQKFWIAPKNKPGHEPLEDHLFSEAVETLQQLKTTFSPFEKLLVIRNTFQQMTSVQQELGTDYLWTMDDLFPVFHFVVVRSRILQLGSEIHFIEDFMEPCLQNGELGIMFTTLKACYYQILQEKNSISS